jgi:hypothetical protein
MTKNEFKSLKSKINKKMDEIRVETKALQRAIDRRMGDTSRIARKHIELRGLLNQLSEAHH